MVFNDSEDDLEKIVFGESHKRIVELIDKSDNKIQESVHSNSNNYSGTGALLDFIVDTQGSYLAENVKQDDIKKSITNNDPEKNVERPLWIDPDDENLEIDVTNVKRLKKLRNDKNELAISGLTYTKRLRTQYEELYGIPTWLENHNTTTNEQRELFLTVSSKIPKNNIKSNFISKLSLIQVKDANKSYPSSGILKSVEFHPNSRIILTAGLNKRIDLFKIDEKKNDHIQNLTLKKFPIYCCHFNGNNEIIASSRKPYFYVYDLEKNIGSFEYKVRGRHEERWDKFWVCNEKSVIAFKGEGGYIPLVCSKTKQWIADLKISGAFNCGCFSADGHIFYAYGNDGSVYIWDVGMRRCIYKFTDEGCVCGIVIDVDSNNKYLSTGSATGVVNIYDINNIYSHINSSTNFHTCNPLKSIMNLTTAATTLKFNNNGNILFLASKQQNASARIFDMQSQSIVCGWPPGNVNIGRIQNCAFSSDNQWMSIVNNYGRALLYRIRC